MKNFTMEKTDQYWTPILLWRKRINIGHLFYYGERDQYWTIILLWRKRINIGHQYNTLFSYSLDYKFELVFICRTLCNNS